MANGLEELDDLLIGAKVNSIQALLTYKLQNEKIWSEDLLKVLKDCNSLIDKILIDQDKGLEK
jgi:hypothetical protein